MKDFHLTTHNLNELLTALQEELQSMPVLVVSSQGAGTGKWGMARLWRAWMASTAKWMAKRGATMPLMITKDGNNYGERPFDANDAHELFTAKWLLLNSDGERLSWSKSGRDGLRAATKGERFIAMMRHEDWATEKGIVLFKPRDSEYEQARLEQER